MRRGKQGILHAGKAGNTVDSVFAYLDYRKFLEDHIREQKAAKPFFSYRFIIHRVGMKSPGHLTQILRGKANISSALALRFARFMRMNKRETEYFELLVKYNQARDGVDAQDYLRRILDFKECMVSTVSRDSFEYYDKWYYSAIRELLYYKPFTGDYQDLARSLAPAISSHEARQAIELLIRMNFIVKNESGAYVRSDSVSTTTGYSARSETINNYIMATIDLGKSALNQFRREDRSLSALTVSLSREGYRTIDEELKRFRRRILEIAGNDSNEDSVYQINFQIFPLARECRKDRGKA
jgi:uncharacterized protein (TIGR02147 family)